MVETEERNQGLLPSSSLFRGLTDKIWQIVPQRTTCETAFFSPVPLVDRDGSQWVLNAEKRQEIVFDPEEASQHEPIRVAGDLAELVRMGIELNACSLCRRVSQGAGPRCTSLSTCKHLAADETHSVDAFLASTTSGLEVLH